MLQQRLEFGFCNIKCCSRPSRR